MAPRSAAAKIAPKDAPSQQIDTNDQEAFPSLGGPAPAPAAAKPSMWSSASSKIKARAPASSAPGGLGRSGAPSSSALPASTSFSLPITSITLSPKAFSELTKKVFDQYGCTIEASTQMKTGLKTFFLRGPDDRKIQHARKTIENGVSRIETSALDVPLSTLGTIIGPKGSTLKTVTDATGCKIDIPRRENLPAPPPRKMDSEDSDDEEEPEEPLVPISLTGPTPAIVEAKARILDLIKDKVSQTSVKIKDIPSDFYPFIAGPGNSKTRDLEYTIGEGRVQIHIPPPSVWKSLEKQGDATELSGDNVDHPVQRKKGDLSINIKGDRELVGRVVDEIRKRYEHVRDSSKTLSFSIPKRQHRFLVGYAADEILQQTNCIVELPPVEDPSDACIIRGPKDDLVQALTLVMEKANAVSVETVDLVAQHRSAASDPLAHAKAILRYLLRTSSLRQIADAHPGVKVFLLSKLPSTLLAPLSLKSLEKTRPRLKRQRQRFWTPSRPSLLPTSSLLTLTSLFTSS